MMRLFSHGHSLLSHTYTMQLCFCLVHAQAASRRTATLYSGCGAVQCIDCTQTRSKQEKHSVALLVQHHAVYIALHQGQMGHHCAMLAYTAQKLGAEALLYCAGANASTSHSLPVQSSKRGLPPAVPLPQPSLVRILHYLHCLANCRHPLLRTCCGLVPQRHM